MDNASFDHPDKSDRGWGHIPFGKVTKKMHVAKKMESVVAEAVGLFEALSVKDVAIEKIERLGKR